MNFITSLPISNHRKKKLLQLNTRYNEEIYQNSLLQASQNYY